MTDNTKNGQQEDENYMPKNPDGSFDIRSYIGHGYLYTQWLTRITEKDRLIQQERLKEFGKDVPQYLPSGERLTRQGYRMGLRFLTPAERSGGRTPGGRDKAPRLVNKAFGTAEKKIFLKHLEQSGNITSAAALTGYSRYTIHSNINKDSRFAEAVEIAKANLNGKVRQSVLDRILNGEKIVERDANGDIIKTTTRDANASLIVKWLESTQKDEFGKRSEITNLHIGDSGDSNARLSQLAMKLGVSLPDNSKKDEDDDIIDVN